METSEYHLFNFLLQKVKVCKYRNKSQVHKDILASAPWTLTNDPDEIPLLGYVQCAWVSVLLNDGGEMSFIQVKILGLYIRSDSIL